MSLRISRGRVTQAGRHVLHTQIRHGGGGRGGVNYWKGMHVFHVQKKAGGRRESIGRQADMFVAFITGMEE